VRKLIVQKYGGSSLSDAENRRTVASRIIETEEQGCRLVVVLSALGRYPARFATDTLIKSIEAVHTPLDKKEKDMLMSCGENISCAIMAAGLRALGKKVVVLTGPGASIETDRQFGEAQIVAIGTGRILELLDEGYIVLVTGFQGVSGEYEITTLGRGGSDTSAAALGAALKADRVEIYTDVEGVMTADPQVYPQARIIRELAYQEMGEMASEGAKVLHSRCVDISSESGTMLLVRSSFSNDAGSIISSRITERAADAILSGLIHKRSITEFVVDLSGRKPMYAVHHRIFEELAHRGISLDLINVCYHKLYFIVSESHAEKVKEYLERSLCPYRAVGGLAKISSVGIGMKGMPGVMARICEVLLAAGVRIHRSVDSFINISCLIDEKDLFRAMESLHESFMAGEVDFLQEMPG
jgi:aspartate kinase